MDNMTLVQHISTAILLRGRNSRYNYTKLNYALPSGAGLDNGSEIDFDKSRPEKIIIHAPYHHMNDDGYYCGWSDYIVLVTPSFTDTMNIAVKGRDRNNTKEYLAELFHSILSDRYKIGAEGTLEYSP